MGWQWRLLAAHQTNQPAVPLAGRHWHWLPGLAGVCFHRSEITVGAPAVPTLKIHKDFSAHTQHVKGVTAADKYFS